MWCFVVKDGLHMLHILARGLFSLSALLLDFVRSYSISWSLDPTPLTWQSHLSTFLNFGTCILRTASSFSVVRLQREMHGSNQCARQVCWPVSVSTLYVLLSWPGSFYEAPLPKPLRLRRLFSLPDRFSLCGYPWTWLLLTFLWILWTGPFPMSPISSLNQCIRHTLSKNYSLLCPDSMRQLQ